MSQTPTEAADALQQMRQATGVRTTSTAPDKPTTVEDHLDPDVRAALTQMRASLALHTTTEGTTR